MATLAEMLGIGGGQENDTIERPLIEHGIALKEAVRTGDLDTIKDLDRRGFTRFLNKEQKQRLNAGIEDISFYNRLSPEVQARHGNFEQWRTKRRALLATPAKEDKPIKDTSKSVAAPQESVTAQFEREFASKHRDLPIEERIQGLARAKKIPREDKPVDITGGAGAVGQRRELAVKRKKEEANTKRNLASEQRAIRREKREERRFAREAKRFEAAQKKEQRLIKQKASKLAQQKAKGVRLKKKDLANLEKNISRLVETRFKAEAKENADLTELGIFEFDDQILKDRIKKRRAEIRQEVLEENPETAALIDELSQEDTQQVDEETATAILEEAGGDVNKAREIARSRNLRF